ncbi:MAG: PDDEXK nuclease domain-containing protein [Blastocatellia bacterium]
MKKPPRKTKALAIKPKKKLQASEKAVAKRLLDDIRAMIEQSRSVVARTVNSTLVMLNWHIGQRIRIDILGEERAEYGERIVESAARQLTAEYGRGYTRQNLFHMIRFVEAFPDKQIVYTLCRQLSWSHFRHLIYLRDELKRDYYAEMCRIERWSVRTLADKIDGMFYERTALSKNTEDLIRKELDALREEDRMSPDLVFRDPYFLDYLDLPKNYSEKDLEDAILRELERFLLELGSDFAFLARQKRISVDEDDFYLDLLFYHRRLRRLVAIELKIGRFKPADAGQMHLYLAWLDRYERQPGEESPLGLILCAEKSVNRIELLKLGEGGIRVAEYLTELPPREILAARLNQAIRLAREKMAMKQAEKTEADDSGEEKQ